MKNTIFPLLFCTGLLVGIIKSGYSQSFPDTPDSCAVTYQYGSSGETFYFCPGGKVKVEYRYYNKTNYGAWKFNDPRIKITLNKTVGMRGIRLNNKQDKGRILGGQYDKYVKYIDLINMNVSFNWDTINKKIKDSSASSDFVLENYPVNCSKFNFNQKLPGKYWYASCRSLKPKELKEFSVKKLKIMKHEIYARYGLRFQNKKMKAYFTEKSWYSPEIENIKPYLRKVEKRNIALIDKILEKKN